MDPLEVLEPKVCQACRVSLVSQELPVYQETLGFQVRQGLVELREHPEPLETLEQQEVLASWVTRDYQGCRVQLVGQAQLALLDRLGQLVPEDSLDKLAILDPEDKMVPLDLLD